jgi:hypothetical protein
MIGDVFGGFLLGMGVSFILGTVLLGRISTHLAEGNRKIGLIYQMLQAKQQPNDESWGEEWSQADADQDWLPDRIDTRDDD